MSRTGDDFGGPAKKRSGWMIPLAVASVVGSLSVLILIYYLAPSPPELVEEQVSYTDSSSDVNLTVAGKRFRIPANYLAFASARKGGAQDKVLLVALLPDLYGYSLTRSGSFSDDTVNSDILRITLMNDPDSVGETARFERIYLPQVENVTGAQGPFGLTEYKLKADAGYGDQDFYVGHTENGMAIWRCFHAQMNMPPPICFRDIEYAPHLTLSYSFKRDHLEDWRDIDADVAKLLREFTQN